MTAFENAKLFFDACESAKGWAGCSQYVADGATFAAQASAMAGIDTVEAYCEWNVGFAAIAPGATWDIHASAFDESTKTALFFATFNAKHTGEGGPVRRGPSTKRGGRGPGPEPEGCRSCGPARPAGRRWPSWSRGPA